MRKRTLFTLTSALLLALFLCRRMVLLSSLSFLLSFFLPKGVLTSDRIEWRQGQLVLSGVHLTSQAMQLTADQLCVSIKGSLFPLHLEPHVTLVHPQVRLCDAGPSRHFPGWGALLPSSRGRLILDVQQGVLLFDSPSIPRLYFSFASDAAQDQIGQLLVAYDPGGYAPLLNAQLSCTGQKLLCGFTIESLQMQHLAAMAPSLFEGTGGALQLQGEVHLQKEGRLEHLACQFTAEDLSLQRELGGLQAHLPRAEGSLSLQRRAASASDTGFLGCDLQGELQLQGAEWTCGALQAKEVGGQLQLSSLRSCTANLEGKLLSGEQMTPFTLAASGGMQDAGWSLNQWTLHWMDGAQASPQLSGSLTALPEQNYLLHVQCGGLGAHELEGARQHLAPLFPSLSQIQLTRGSVNGQVSLWMRGSTLLEVALNEGDLKDLEISLPEQGVVVAVAQGEGACQLTHRASGQWGVQMLKGRIQGGSLHRGALHCTEAEGEVCITEGGYLPSVMHIRVLDIPTTISFAQGPQCLATIEMEGGEATLTTSLRMQAGRAELLGVLCFPSTEELIHFQCALHSLWSMENLRIEGGTFHAERLTSRSLPSLPFGFEGSLQLAGRFDRDHLEGLFTGCDLVVSHPQGVLQLPQVAAVASFDLKTYLWQLRLPLQGAAFVLQQPHMQLEQIDGELELHGLQGRALVRSARLPQWDHAPFAGEIQLDLTHRPTLVVASARAGSLLVHHLEGALGAQFAMDVSWMERNESWVRLKGEAVREGEQYRCTFDPQETHLFGNPLRISRCLLGANGELHSLEVKSEVGGTHLSQGIRRWASAPLFPAIDGALQWAVQYELADKKWQYQVQSEELAAEGVELGAFWLKGNYMGGCLQIERLQTDLLRAQGDLSVQGGHLFVSSLLLHCAPVQFRGELDCTLADRQIEAKVASMRIDLPSRSCTLWGACHIDPLGWQATARLSGTFESQGECPVQAKSQTPFALSFAPDQGVVIRDLVLQVADPVSQMELATLQLPLLAFDIDRNRVQCTQMQVQLASECVPLLVEREILPAAAMRYEVPQLWTLDGSLDPKQGQCHAHAADLPLFLCATWRPAHFLEIQLQEATDQEGIRGHWSWTPHGLFCDALQGCYFGLQVQCKRDKEEDPFVGSMQMDFTRLPPLCPRELQRQVEYLGLGGGYEWEGEMTLWPTLHCLGTIRGRSFQCMGRALSSLEAHIEAHPTHVELRNLHIVDEMGDLQAKLMRFTRGARSEQWIVEVPIAQASEIRTSFLHDRELPFTIKHFTMTEFKGFVDDRSSFSGRAMLTFATETKRPYSLPLEVIKRIGLDPGVLTPAGGELDLQLKGDTFFVLSLKNSFSDGHHSEFSLAEEDASYFDFDGNLHVNLKVRQHALLKMVEPFTVTLRGNLAHPEYGFQFP